MSNTYPSHLTVEQAADLLQIARSTFYHSMTDGSLDFAKIASGKRILFSRDRLLKWFFNR